MNLGMKRFCYLLAWSLLRFLTICVALVAIWVAIGAAAGELGLALLILFYGVFVFMPLAYPVFCLMVVGAAIRSTDREVGPRRE